MERGIQINDGEDNYVECKIIQGADTIKGEMRLKGHMTDHLEGDKWSFRVKTKKKPVFGMTRFSLQAPGTRNYAYEWVYHQLLKEEEVIHLNYDFIRLKLNDKDLGIYAIEEHFGQHVLDHNDRPKGAILRWNPNLYWEQRIDELQGTYLDEQYSDSIAGQRIPNEYDELDFNYHNRLFSDPVFF
ncbi:MAG: CotH kinase family protein [Crocinitomicaceae bacterium]|nr:CotH kinase family protein [Crocinitomicaceae bacterium]